MFEGREWYRLPGAAPETLEKLKAAAPAGLPANYFELLSFSDGGEGPLPVSPLNFCLESAKFALERLQSDNFGVPEFNSVFVFGGNGGGEYLAFDLRQDRPWPIVYIDLVAGLESAEFVAPNFDSFLAMVGLEEE